MTEDSQGEQPRPKGQVFLMRSKVGQWMFEVRDQADQVMGGGGGYADQFEALEAAEDAFPYMDLDAVIPTEEPDGYMAKAAGKAPE